jgi:hypothetical protein
VHTGAVQGAAPVLGLSLGLVVVIADLPSKDPNLELFDMALRTFETLAWAQVGTWYGKSVLAEIRIKRAIKAADKRLSNGKGNIKGAE